MVGYAGGGENSPAPPRPWDMFARRFEDDERRPTSPRFCGSAAIFTSLFLLFGAEGLFIVSLVGEEGALAGNLRVVIKLARSWKIQLRMIQLYFTGFSENDVSVLIHVRNC